MRLRIVMVASGLAAGVAFLVARLAYSPVPVAESPPPAPEVPSPALVSGKPREREGRPELGKSDAFRLDDEAMQAGALPGQRVLVFKSKADMEEFLKQAAANGISVLGRLDKLNALRVGFLNPHSLAQLSDGE